MYCLDWIGYTIGHWCCQRSSLFIILNTHILSIVSKSLSLFTVQTPFHFYFFHLYFSLITTHFHFSFFDSSLSRFAVWNSLSLFIVGNQASPKLVVPPSCEPKFASSAITFKAHQTTLFGGSGGSKCGQQKYKIEFALSLVNVNFQTWFCRLAKKPYFWISCLSMPMSIGQIRLLDFTEQTQSLISAVPTLDRGFWQALPSLVPPIKRVTAVTLDFLQCNQARTYPAGRSQRNLDGL